MRAAGILAKDEPVELCEGYLVGKDQARPEPCAMPSDPPRLEGRELWPLSLEQYQRMIAEGILEEDDPVELLDGYIIATDRGRGPGMPPGPEHAFSTNALHTSLVRALAPAWVVRCQDPIALGLAAVPGAGAAPQPDVSVAQGPNTLYAHRYPGAADLCLVAEVADSSLLTDRRAKAVRYAQAGIPLYWIVNLVDRQIEVYSDPDTAAGQYRSVQVFDEHQQVVLSWAGLAPVTFAVRDFLP
jgi:Uma2 family endonuclease